VRRLPLTRTRPARTTPESSGACVGVLTCLAAATTPCSAMRAPVAPIKAPRANKMAACPVQSHLKARSCPRRAAVSLINQRTSE
jgi:hypothetical protein